MNNIKAVRLENFQSHLDTYIEFNQGLNVIVGQSDSGKTAILRGIRWALYNQPRGTDFIRVSGDFVRVTVRFEDETVIIRERTGSKNRYTVQRPDQEELVLEGFGIHVPEEVMAAHGMGHMRIDQDNEIMIHLSQQLDGPFLLEQTSSIRAKTLGRISGAHFLDMAIRNTTKDLSQLNLKMKQEQEVIEKVKVELEPYAMLDEQKTKLIESEFRIKKVEAQVTKRDKLEALKLKWQQLKQEEERTIKISLLVKDVESWQKKVDEMKTMVQQYVMFKQKDNRMRELTRSIEICLNWVAKTKHIERIIDQYERTNQNVSLLRQLVLNNKRMKELSYSMNREKTHMKKSAFVHSVNLDSLAQIEKKRVIQRQLLHLREGIQQIQTQRMKIKQVYQKLPDVNEVTRKQEIVEQTSERFLRIKTIQAQLQDYQMRIQEGKRFMEKQMKEQELAEIELHKLLLTAGTCPTCGQSICKHENN
ncbi:AAA family ATPase [Halalkalibacter alkalisediminis]|uniref:AAA family ATPase n=1 Tax=Halalkalibacter alkalisediminis TaxID=935616 RepID=A0ABV6NED6_9BACI|nr:AAA family ATPase [Halalkalibacter alkalisediminis]